MLATVMVVSLISAGALALTKGAMKAPKVSKAPVIDGKLDDAAWSGGSVVLGNNNQGGKASVKIEAWVRWDDANLYVAFKNHRPKSSLVTKVKDDGGNVWEDDENEIFIDPSVDGKGTWYQFIINAIGTRFQAARNGAANLDFAKWQAKAVQYSDYWVLEMKIPFSMLGGAPKIGSKWGLNLCGHTGTGENIT